MADRTAGDALQPLHFVQKTDQVLDSIRTAIVTGQLEPGQPLRDRQLAEQLGVSRTPVREAFVRLGTAGLVVGSAGGGWTVARFSEQDVRELFEVRRVLEPLGLQRLAAGESREKITELVAFFDEFRGNVPSERFDEYLARDHAFHKLIVSCSGNRRVMYLYSLMEHQIDRGRNFLSRGYAGRVGQNLEEHFAICDAVGRGDWAAAEAALAHHLSMGEETMVSFLAERDAALGSDSGDGEGAGSSP